MTGTRAKRRRRSPRTRAGGASLLQLLGRRRRNRKLHRGSSGARAGANKAKRERGASDSSKAKPKPKRKPRWRRLRRALPVVVRRAGQLGLVALKTTVALAGLTAIGAAGFYGYRAVVSTKAFDVEQIAVAGASRVPADTLRARIGGAVGRSLFDLDLDRLARAIQSHPWVARARVWRELPSTLRVEVVEHEAGAALLSGRLYLVSRQGVVFKPATPRELRNLPVITGVAVRRRSKRWTVEQRRVARLRLRAALEALKAYRAGERPPLSEVHLGPEGEVTFFLRDRGTALRFGKQFDEQRLRHLDAVWAALGRQRRQARAIYLDHEVRPDRVIVRLTPSDTGEGQDHE